ncbi:MAG: DUF2513 domain-containing protein [Coriobacteriales bacterium]|nr:DUF2513 domain-containing protein [Coriobacteriales bacterium]
MKFIRHILLFAEAAQGSFEASAPADNTTTPKEVVYYHVELMKEAGLIKAQIRITPAYAGQTRMAYAPACAYLAHTAR